MNDPKPIEDALRAAEIEVSDAMPSNDDELETDEDLVKKSPNLILARMKWIGNQITDVSKINTASPVYLRQQLN